MNRRGALLWGFVATLALTGLLAGSQSLRLTRMNLPYMLGTMVTPQRDRAKVIGFANAGVSFAGLTAEADIVVAAIGRPEAGRLGARRLVLPKTTSQRDGSRP